MSTRRSGGERSWDGTFSVRGSCGSLLLVEVPRNDSQSQKNQPLVKSRDNGGIPTHSFDNYYRALARTNVTSSGCSFSPIQLSTAMVTIWLICGKGR